jgi:hypothetical protein
MTNLVSLELSRADVQLGAPCALPPYLTRLQLRTDPSGVGNWGVHLAGCKQLRELQLDVPWGKVAVHPTLLVQGIAEQLTGLVKLGIGLNTDEDEDDEPEDVLDHVLAAAEGEVAAGPDDISQLPLAIAGGSAEPGLHVVAPPPNMGALSGLQHMNVSGWWLVAISERYWRVLASCSSLRSLSGLHASVPPPAGVTFPHLTQLEVATSTSPGDTLALLGAFPALERLGLTVVPTVSGE